MRLLLALLVAGLPSLAPADGLQTVTAAAVLTRIAQSWTPTNTPVPPTATWTPTPTPTAGGGASVICSNCTPPPTQIPLATPGGLVSLNTPVANIPGNVAAVGGAQVATGTGQANSGTQRIVLAAGVPVGPVLITSTGTYVTITVQGFATACFTLTVGFTGTVVIESSMDGGTTWAGIPFWYGAASTIPTIVTSQANPGTGSHIYAPTGGAPLVRLRPSVFTSGAGAAALGAASNEEYPLSTAWSVTSAPAIAAGSNVIGSVTAGFPIAAQALSVSSPALATGTAPVGTVKASAAVLAKVIVTSTSTSTITCVKIYNQATNPTAGGGTPVLRCAQPSIGTTVFDLGPQGMALTTGLAYSATAGIPDNDTTPLAATTTVTFLYK